MLNSTMSDYTELGSLNAIEAKIELNGMLAKDSHVRQWHRDYETPDMKTYLNTERRAGEPMPTHPDSWLARHEAILAPTSVFAASSGTKVSGNEDLPLYTLSVKMPGMDCTAGYITIPIDPQEMSVQTTPEGEFMRLHTGQLKHHAIVSQDDGTMRELTCVDFIKDRPCHPDDLWYEITAHQGPFWDTEKMNSLRDVCTVQAAIIEGEIERLTDGKGWSGRAYLDWKPMPAGSVIQAKVNAGDTTAQDLSLPSTRNNPYMTDPFDPEGSYLEQRYHVYPKGSTESSSSRTDATAA